MPASRQTRDTGKGRPGPQNIDQPGNRPNPPAGMPPEPNPGQTDLGTGYTVLRGGQDVQQPGLYFDEHTCEVKYYDRGERLGRTQDTWYYLGDEQNVSRRRLEELIRAQGYAGPLDGLRVVESTTSR
jgi:hypothetical protein